jgi:hypothetical protein
MKRRFTIDQKDTGSSRRLMLDLAKEALELNGWRWVRPLSGFRTEVWEISKDGRNYTACVRTTRDRWFAFNGSPDGGWRTVEDMDYVIVAAFDVHHARGKVRGIDVYLFPAQEVVKRLNEAYEARARAGHKMEKGFGLWLPLDRQDNNPVLKVGSDLGPIFPPIASFESDGGPDSPPEPDTLPRTRNDGHGPTNIGDILNWAREGIAHMAGVPVELVKLDLKIG